MRHLGIGSALALTAMSFAAASPSIAPEPGSKKHRRLKPSGAPIPEGTYTRQQRRADERRARKGPSDAQ